jgi:hypothetical protein
VSHQQPDKVSHQQRDQLSHQQRDKVSHPQRDKVSHPQRNKVSHPQRDKVSHLQRDRPSMAGSNTTTAAQHMRHYDFCFSLMSQPASTCFKHLHFQHCGHHKHTFQCRPHPPTRPADLPNNSQLTTAGANMTAMTANNRSNNCCTSSNKQLWQSLGPTCCELVSADCKLLLLPLAVRQF